MPELTTEWCVTVDSAYPEDGLRVVAIKIQDQGYELNVLIPPAEVPLLEKVARSEWLSGTVKIGTSAGCPTYWSCDSGVVSVLVGSDDECWDFGVWFEQARFEQILKDVRNRVGGA